MGSLSRPRKEKPELAYVPTGLRVSAHVSGRPGAGSLQAKSGGSPVITGLLSTALAARLGAGAETVCLAAATTPSSQWKSTDTFLKAQAPPAEVLE